MDTKMRGVNTWKPARCSGIGSHVHGYEQATNIFLGYRCTIQGVRMKSIQNKIIISQKAFIIHFYVLFIASGVGLSPLHCGHFWLILPAPEDR
jgi:hypothetical protein